MRIFKRETEGYNAGSITGLTGTGVVATILGVILFVVLVSVLFSIKTVTPGTAAVVTSFGELRGVRENGTHLALFEGYTIYDLTAKQVTGHHEGGSRDGQFVFVDIAFTYSLRTEKLAELYSRVGTQQNLEDKFVHPVIADAVKRTAAQYGADEILPKQEEYRQAVKKAIAEQMNQEYLTVGDLVITNIDFTPEYNAILEQKQINEQTAISQRQVVEQKGITQKLELEQYMRQKDAELAAARIDAQKQELLVQALTPELLQKMYIDMLQSKWNGAFPTTMTGDGSILSLPIK